MRMKKVRIARGIRVIFASSLLGFCLSTAGCSFAEKKLEPVYQALLNDDSAHANELNEAESLEQKSQGENNQGDKSQEQEADESKMQQSEEGENADYEDADTDDVNAENINAEGTNAENTEKDEANSTAASAGNVTINEADGSSESVRLSSGKKILLTGDSRTVCLYCSQIYDETEYPKHVFYNIDEAAFTGYTNESIVVAKGGEGCSWMRAVGVPNALSHLDEADALVIWFGVNDLHVFADYINYVNSLVGQYDIPIYYMTIGPCDGKWESKNSDVLAFNEALTQLLDPSVIIIDAYSYIKDGLDNGLFATMDGLHYDYNTSKAIYDYMVDRVDVSWQIEKIQSAK